MRPLPMFIFLCAFALALPSPTAAFEFELPRINPGEIHERITVRLNSGLQSLCDRLQDSGLPLPLPSFCTPPPPPPPPLVDACPNVPGDQESGPCADEECVADGGTWNGESCIPPPPEETIGHVVISEVHYDVDVAHGENSGNGNNEWVELYNGSAETVDLSGWKLADNNASDALPEGTLLPAGEFLIITATSSTAGFWPDIPEDVEIIVLGSLIGNSLAAGGDVVLLRDDEDTLVDAVSWGSNTTAFDPSVPGVTQGESVARILLTVDTDTAADWEERGIPSPGLADVPLPSGVPETL